MVLNLFNVVFRVPLIMLLSYPSNSVLSLDLRCLDGMFADYNVICLKENFIDIRKGNFLQLHLLNLLDIY